MEVSDDSTYTEFTIEKLLRQSNALVTMKKTNYSGLKQKIKDNIRDKIENEELFKRRVETRVGVVQQAH